MEERRATRALRSMIHFMPITAIKDAKILVGGKIRKRWVYNDDIIRWRSRQLDVLEGFILQFPIEEDAMKMGPLEEESRNGSGDFCSRGGYDGGDQGSP
ncbi:hypothetical protein ACLOJK_022740 [Asimina triloba]